MGISISWIGVKGRSRADVLAELDMRDTGQPDAENRAKFSCADLPDDWLIIRSRHFGFASPQRIADLSAGALVIGCAIEEHVMFSGVRAYRNGRALWHVIHDPQNGLYDLSVGGKPPVELAGIRDRAVREQDQEGGVDAGVDLIFDVPLDLAQAVCGFRHDGAGSSESLPAFTRLKPNPTTITGEIIAMIRRRWKRS